MFTFGTLCRIFIFILTSFGFNVLFLVTNKYLGPSYHVIIDATSSMCTMIIDIIIKGNYSNLLMQIPGYVLIVIGSLIYNEIVIINCMGMDHGTKTQIEKRASENYDNFKEINEEEIKEEINNTQITFDLY